MGALQRLGELVWRWAKDWSLISHAIMIEYILQKLVKPRMLKTVEEGIAVAFRIGEVYRYSNKNWKAGIPDETVDGLRNFFFETYGGEGRSSVFFQKGIHNLATVEDLNGEKRIPAIIISSSPHKAGTDITPWEDEFDPDHGRIRYFGDNKTPRRSADKAPGNTLLLNAFYAYSSPDQEIRQKMGVPLIFLKRVEYDGRKKGNLMFQGFGIIESVELVTQYDPKLENPYFANYVYNMMYRSIR